MSELAVLHSKIDAQQEAQEEMDEPNEETIAAIEEGRAMRRGEIPTKRYKSVDEFWKDLDL